MAQHPEMAQIGPPAWAELHAWADRFAAKVGDSCGCGVFAQDAARALHDLVSVRLGKHAMYPETLREVAQMYQAAAGLVTAEQRSKWPHSKTFDSEAEARAWVNYLQEPNPDKWPGGRVLPWQVDVFKWPAEWEPFGEETWEVQYWTERPGSSQSDSGSAEQTKGDVFAIGSNYQLAYGDYNKGVVVDAPKSPSWFVATMTKGRSHHGKSFDKVEDAKRDAAIRAKRLGLLPGDARQEHGIYPWPEGMFDDDDDEEEDMFEDKAKKLHAHFSQSFLDTILHTAVGAATALAVTKALTPSSNIKEGEKPPAAPPPAAPLPSVLSPAYVEGDQANVDLGTLLEEIDAILKNPETMGIVDADTLTIVRE